MRQSGKPAYLDKVRPRKMGQLARLLPILEGGRVAPVLEPVAAGREALQGASWAFAHRFKNRCHPACRYEEQTHQTE
jgi:hypothetical protein